MKAGRPSGRTKERVKEVKGTLDEEKRLNTRLPKSEYRAIQRYAFEREMTVSDVVKIAVHEYMKRNPLD